MGKRVDKIKALSGGDGVDFKPLPTSDRPSGQPARSTEPACDLPVVIAARNLKRNKRCKILKIGLTGIFVLSVVVAIIAVTTTESSVKPVQDQESEPIMEPRMNAAPLVDQEMEPRMNAGPLGNQDNQDNPASLANDKSSAHIALKLYNEERKTNTGNMVFSPFSIQSALSMIALGAKEKTLKELITFLSASGDGDLNGSVENIKSSFAAILPTLNSTDNYTIETANSVFLSKNYRILETMSKDLKKSFLTEFNTTDFSNSELSASLINGWVEEKTMNKIKDLIPADALDSDTQMVLVNALYFKGMWENKFDKEDTTKRSFHVSDTQAVQADFMHQRSKLLVGGYKERTVLALPYSGDRFTMYLIIPHKVRIGRSRYFDDGQKSKEDDLSVVEAELEADLLTESLNKTKFSKKDVNLLLPTFKIEAELQLKNILQKIGECCVLEF
jgi:serpin B